jgi:hypothetical protein
MNYLIPETTATTVNPASVAIFGLNNSAPI